MRGKVSHVAHALSVVLTIVSFLAISLVATSLTSSQFVSAQSVPERLPSVNAVPEGTIEIVEQPFTVRISQYGTFRILIPESVAKDNNASIDIRVHRRITSRTEFREIADEGSLSRVSDVATVTIPNIRVDETGAHVVTVPLQATNQGLSGLYMAEPGVYPITIVARQLGKITARTLTYLHRVTPNDPNGSVITAMVVSLRAIPSIQPDGAVVVTDEIRQTINRFIDTISTVNAPFSLAIQPEILSSLLVSEDDNDRTLLDRLRRSLAGRTLALSPFVPIDVSAASRAGVAEEYLRQLRVGEDISLQVLPDSMIQRTTAIISDPLDEEGLDLLRDAGRRTIIVMPSAMESFRWRDTPSVKSRQERSDMSTVTMLMADQHVYKVMSSPISKPVERAHRVAAELLLHRADLVALGIPTSEMRFIISTFDGSFPSQPFTQSLLSALQREPAFAVTNVVPETDASVNTPTVGVPKVSSGDISVRTKALADLQIERTATTSMLPENDPRILLWQQLDGLIISSMVSDYMPYIDGLRQQFQALREAVTMSNPGSITLGSRNGSIRFQMRNTAPENLTVRILLNSPKLEFPEGSKLVTLAASSTTDVVIPVRTRTNGRFPVRLEVRTPDGALTVIEPVTFSARVTALAGIGQFVMISFILIVLAWWWASWRKSRREAEQSDTVLSA
jgi:hypothetical protein